MHKQSSVFEEARITMRILGIALRILICVFIAGSLLACNLSNTSSQAPGVTYIISRGNPPADSIAWSPKDPTKILVNAIGLVQHSSQVYIFDIATKKKTMLVETDNGAVSGIWAPDGKQVILLVEGGTNGFSQGGLWVMNVEDNSLDLFSDKAGVVAWLPDGNTIAVLTKDSASAQNPQQISIYLMDVHTKETKLIYSNREAISYSGFSPSPDGNYLVFSLNSNYYSITPDLFMLDVRTRAVNQLTHDGASGDPQWSAKGDLIVYVKATKIEDKTTNSLHIFSSDGNCDLKIPNVESAFSPTWSPDGRQIAFLSDDGIYVLDLDIAFGRDIYQNTCL
jgi:Tol biopolymer transport system component